MYTHTHAQRFMGIIDFELAHYVVYILSKFIRKVPKLSDLVSATKFQYYILVTEEIRFLTCMCARIF